LAIDTLPMSLQKLITLCDVRNNPMTCTELLAIMQRMANSDLNLTENHWYYLHQSKKLPILKNRGVQETVQGTTNKEKQSNNQKYPLMAWSC